MSISHQGVAERPGLFLVVTTLTLEEGLPYIAVLRAILGTPQHIETPLDRIVSGGVIGAVVRAANNRTNTSFITGRHEARWNKLRRECDVLVPVPHDLHVSKCNTDTILEFNPLIPPLAEE